MTYYDLRSALEQLDALNRLDDNLHVTIEHHDHEWDGKFHPHSPSLTAFPTTSTPLSVTLKGRELIISCC